MELQKQLTSLSLSQRLKELGVPQDSLGHWVLHHSGEWELIIQRHGFAGGLESVAAYSVAELDELLPKAGLITNQVFELGHRCIWYLGSLDSHVELEKTGAEARGEMLAYLLEHNLITLD